MIPRFPVRRNDFVSLLILGSRLAKTMVVLVADLTGHTQKRQIPSFVAAMARNGSEEINMNPLGFC